MNTREAVECLEDNLVAAYVARALGAPERQRVTEHLSTCDVCLAITCAAMDSGDAPAAAEPERIGGYVLLEMTGDGPLGRVYAARDPARDQPVALQVLRCDSLRDGDARARIMRDARAAAQLRHPRVRPIRDVGELEDGVFVATDPSDAVTLTQWLARPDRRWQDALRVFRAAGAGLAAAHGAGLAHGGFTPDCVRVAGADEVVVADFGLAAFVIERDASAARAPEQRVGAPGDARADQYAFAYALYEALHDAAPPAGASEAPPRIRRALDRALAASPDRRFASMAALLAALDGGPRARPLALAAAGVLVAALVVGSATRSSPEHGAAAGSVDGAAHLREPREPLRVPRDADARRDRLVTALGDELLVDVVRDGNALLAETPRPATPALAVIASAHALLGHRADAANMIRRMAQLDPDLAPRAAADLAAYEGRLDDAIAALRGRSSASEQVALAAVLLRRGDPRAALAASAIGDAPVPVAYLAASLAIAAGDAVPATRTAAAWRASDEPERRRYAELLTGDLRRAEQRWSAASDAYRASARLGDSWLVHERLARAAIGAHDWATAERELVWCLDHRGQAALIVTPSLALLPEVALALARVRDARHAAPSELRAAYRAVAELGAAAQHDPWTDEARRRMAQLPP